MSCIGPILGAHWLNSVWIRKMKKIAICSIEILLALFLSCYGLTCTQLAYCTAQPNLVANANMESGHVDKPLAWTTNVASGNVRQMWSATKCISGKHSLRTLMSSNGQAEWQQVVNGIDPTVKYRFRAHIYATNVGAQIASLEIQWLTSQGDYISTSSAASSTANVWAEVKALNIVPPADAAKARIALRTYKRGDYYFDDVALIREDVDRASSLFGGKFPIGLYDLPDTQLLISPDMEPIESISGVLCRGNGLCPPGWSRNVASGMAVQTWDTGNHNSGAYSLKTVMTGSGQADWRQLITNITAGTTYTLSAAINAGNVTPGSHSVEIQWFNGDKYISRDTIASNTVNVWSTLTSKTLTAPAGANRAWVLCAAYSAGTYNFDDVRFSKNVSLQDRYTEAHNAGFNFIRLYGGGSSSLSNLTDTGMQAAYDLGNNSMYQPVGSNTPVMYIPEGVQSIKLVNAENEVKRASSLALWYGPDEPGFSDVMGAPGVTNGLNIVKRNDITPRHLIWLNEAPVGHRQLQPVTR